MAPTTHPASTHCNTHSNTLHQSGTSFRGILGASEQQKWQHWLQQHTAAHIAKHNATHSASWGAAGGFLGKSDLPKLQH